MLELFWGQPWDSGAAESLVRNEPYSAKRFWLLWNLAHLQLPFRVCLWSQIWHCNGEQELQSCVRGSLIPSSCAAEPPILLFWLHPPCAGDKQNLPQTVYSRLNPALWCTAAEGGRKTWESSIFLYKINAPHLLLIFLSVRLWQSSLFFSRWTSFAKQNIGSREGCSISAMVANMYLYLWILPVFGFLLWIWVFFNVSVVSNNFSCCCFTDSLCVWIQQHLLL